MILQIECARCFGTKFEEYGTTVINGNAAQLTRCMDCRYKFNVVVNCGRITTHEIFPQDPE